MSQWLESSHTVAVSYWESLQPSSWLSPQGWVPQQSQSGLRRFLESSTRSLVNNGSTGSEARKPGTVSAAAAAATSSVSTVTGRAKLGSDKSDDLPSATVLLYVGCCKKVLPSRGLSLSVKAIRTVLQLRLLLRGC